MKVSRMQLICFYVFNLLITTLKLQALLSVFFDFHKICTLQCISVQPYLIKCKIYFDKRTPTTGLFFLS